MVHIITLLHTNALPVNTDSNRKWASIFGQRPSATRIQLVYTIILNSNQHHYSHYCMYTKFTGNEQRPCCFVLLHRKMYPSLIKRVNGLAQWLGTMQNASLDILSNGFGWSEIHWKQWQKCKCNEPICWMYREHLGGKKQWCALNWMLCKLQTTCSMSIASNNVLNVDFWNVLNIKRLWWLCESRTARADETEKEF